ncbi:MAG: flagellar hook-length control protein FliK [Bacillota bacterium]
MRADAIAITPETAALALNRAGNSGSGTAGEGVSDFIIALIGAMAQQDNTCCLQGGSPGDFLPVQPGSVAEGKDIRGMHMVPENAGVSAGILSMLTLQMNQVQAGNVSGEPSLHVADNIASATAGIQLADLGQQQPVRVSAGGPEDVVETQSSEVYIPGKAEEKVSANVTLKPQDLVVQPEVTPGIEIKASGVEIPAQNVVAKSKTLNSESLQQVATRVSLQVSTAQTWSGPVNPELSTGSVTTDTGGGQWENAGGGPIGRGLSETGANTGENHGFGGSGSGGEAEKEDQLLSVTKQWDKNTGDKAGSSPEHSDGEISGLGIESPGGHGGITGADEGNLAADGGRNGEQVKVNAGNIHIQNVAPQKFPVEILPHILNTVRSAGHENKVTVIRLKLEPENMGEINIKLSYVKGKLTAYFFTNSGLVKEAVESSLPQLKETLTQYNVDLGDAAAFVGQEQQGHQGTGYTGFGHNGKANLKFKFDSGDFKGMDTDDAAIRSAGGSERLVNILV